MNTIILSGIITLFVKDADGIHYGNIHVYGLKNDIPFTFDDDTEKMYGSADIYNGCSVMLKGSLDHDSTGIQLLVDTYAVYK